MTASNTITTLQTLGVELPADFAAAALRYDQAVEQLHLLDKPQWTAADLVDELLDPESPHDMRELLTRAALPTALGAGGPQAAANRLRQETLGLLARRWSAMLTARRPELLAQLQPRWRDAGTALVALVSRYPEGDAQAVIAAGDEAVAAWRQHPELIGDLEAIEHAVRVLNAGVHVDNGNGWTPPRPLAGHHKNVPIILTLLDVEPEQWQQVNEAAANGWEAVARTVLQLGSGERVWSLTDPDGAKDRHARITAHEAAVQRKLDQEAEQLSKEAWRNSREGSGALAHAQHYGAA